ncbi:ubiquitin carboxyl-terminal hydrolase 1 [Malaclemys terrapin pileata]|uniref:ubiquitin carboxyl-terminal hydrolase 1 n=1 Tax=Malaclemys terrapin pileata TaxID=2991368 RepID=UPI0023A8A38F|nr:ubiquitin carboxyl-terminal hydrolase 1 [Malaclemys terrapin pileata]XP_053893389.1 ubiquitin carboxyl-terminal hydrolase 1 [Malaclemys terrapin pileata]XP_053893390.1 ubiquitin carboxyl-terminal hydrolase 1 [Malaclemys terrapin pileata]
MPGVLPTDATGLLRGSPSKKNRLSLKLFQKKETKRALDFTESQENEQKSSEYRGSEIDQVVPAAQPPSPISCEKKDNMLPFVGLNNLGNTCYLNSILQVLYFCPGFKTGVKHLFNIISKKREMLKDEGEQKSDKGSCKEDPLASYELICSLHSLILSVEQLQASFLLNPEKYTDELATQPRRLLNTLRELNPMYEGYLQHDAQEVLQCILGNIQETCQILKKEELKNIPMEEPIAHLEEKSNQNTESNGINSPGEENDYATSSHTAEESEDKLSKGNGKRKSDTESGNAKKKSKVSKEHNAVEGNQRQTRSKRKATVEKLENHTDAIAKYSIENEIAKPTQKKSRLRLNWFKSSGKQPSILSKFCSVGKLANNLGSKEQMKETDGCEIEEASVKCENGNIKEYFEPASPVESAGEKGIEKPLQGGSELAVFELVEKLFQGQLVLRTRCLECECFTERREDFQDISVPVQEDELSKAEESSEISPEPKTEMKTLKWAISQFASVERIVGEDKYFCENCRHYTEAERSLLFDKMPEVITVHLKCFAANGLEFDCYGGLSKINTPLLTPLKLSLEEWSTKSTNDTYGLFAVVMHSGITISSGHYTASVKITDLNSLELDKGNFITDQMYEVIKPEPLNEEEARAVAEDYDDGEVSFRVNGNAQSSKTLSKKNMEAVGLLGGQKNKSDCDLYNNKATNPEKVVNTLTENKNFESTSTNGILEFNKSTENGDQNGIAFSGLENKALYVLQSLKEYEGKWLLFDDSEVKVTEEKDFLNSLSPTSSSTSTPYLLFYKKIVE